MKNTFKVINNKIKGTKDYQIVVSGSGIGAIGAMIWAKYYKENFSYSLNHYRLVLDSLPQNYLSFKTNTNQFKSYLQNMMKLANVDGNHPFSQCSLMH